MWILMTWSITWILKKKKKKPFSERKVPNIPGGGLLIYFKDDLYVARVTGLENDVDEMGEHAHHMNPS